MDKHHPSGPVEVNMEVSVTADEVMRAGGFGATEVIEDHLLDARGYEESKDTITEERSGITLIDKVEDGETHRSQDGYEAVNMEASLFSEDVIRAGGFGATDNIGSFLPVASDYTDFEGNLRDARDYEECEEKHARPGLGWRSR